VGVDDFSDYSDYTDADYTDWHALEQRIPLDDLPTFHRAFLAGVQPDQDWDGVFLRQIQSKVQASLKQLERSGTIRREGDTLLVPRQLVPQTFRHYL
jgi:hypothetical protein